MKILLLIPRYNVTFKADFQYTFPLGLGYISNAMRKANHEVTVINLNHRDGTVSDIIMKEMDANHYDVVATGSNSMGYHMVQTITNAARVHKSNPIVILGGSIITSEKKLMFEALKPDYAVFGEGEMTIVDLLDAIEKKRDMHEVDGVIFRDEKGETVINKPRMLIKNIDECPLPDMEGLEFGEYIKHQYTNKFYYHNYYDEPRCYPILASRSCPFECTFCLPKDTLVLTSDLKWKHIQDITIEDTVVSIVNMKGNFVKSKVKALFKEYDEIYEIKTTDGTIYSTKEHPWLTDHWRWRRTDQLKVGQFLRKISKKPSESPNETKGYMEGYLAGATLGDGTISHHMHTNGTSDKLYTANVWKLVGDYEMLDYVLYLGEQLNLKYNKSQKFNGGKIFKCNRCVQTTTRKQVEYIETLLIGRNDIEYKRGFIAGIYDAEGSCSSDSIRISNNNKELLDRIGAYLSSFNFKYTIEKKGLRISGSIKTYTDFMALFQPKVSHKRGFIFRYKRIRTPKVKIISIKRLDHKQTVYNLETEQGNFIADGFVTHNCYHSMGRGYRMRSMDDMMKEVEMAIQRYDINILCIYDDLFSYRQERIYEFCDRLMELNKRYNRIIKWTAQLSVNSMDERLLRRMKECGCETISYGFESYSEEVLRSMHKPITPQKIDYAIKLTMQNHIGIQGNFIFGDPAETKETAQRTLDYWKSDCKAQCSLLFIQPYPGSVIYERCFEKGILKDRLDYITNKMTRDVVVNMTERMTDEELASLAEEMKQLRLKYSKFITPKKVKQNDLDIQCPYCDKDITYRNFWMQNKMMYATYGLQCRECGMRFNVVSPLFKVLKDTSILPLAEKTYRKTMKMLAKVIK